MILGSFSRSLLLFEGLKRCPHWMGNAWWQLAQVNELTAQKTALEADIAEMQVNAATLAKKEGRIKIEDCGGRLRTVADKRQSDDATDWHGIWNNQKTGQTFVIPKGTKGHESEHAWRALNGSQIHSLR